MKPLKKNMPMLPLDLDKDIVTVQFSLETELLSPCSLLLCLDGLEAGIVFGRVTKDTKKTKNSFLLTLTFNWSETVNSSVFERSINKDVVSVELVCVENRAQHWSLGAVSRKSLASFVSPAILSATDVLVETRRSQLNGNLPVPRSELSSDVTLVAFYLPQYHPILENDIWWGAGFTEWTKVAAAKPCFRGHQQPRLPGELGFYDLRVAEVVAEQVALAREYGIGAFCFYYYWFGGRRLLERPMDLFLANPQIDMPFCICWANEAWTRRWDGLETDVLIAQPHTPEMDAGFILDVIPVLKDPRYLRVNGKPLLLVYRAALLSVPEDTTALWRQLCRDAGIGEIELAAVESFNFESPEDYGFDSTVEFPPHGFNASDVAVKPLKKKKPFEGKAWRYVDAAAFYCGLPAKPWRQFRGVMPGWDNTPRRGRNGYAFIKSSPDRYAVWLTSALKDTRARFADGERLVFINAWNEWGEGALLEPDQKYGRAYLAATRDALLGETGWEQHLSSLVEDAPAGDISERRLAADAVKAQIEAYQRTLEFITQQQATHVPRSREEKLALVTVTDIWPEGLEQNQKISQARGSLDQFGPPNQSHDTPVRCHRPIRMLGWMHVPGFAPSHPPVLQLMLTHKKTKQFFFAKIENRLPRPDLFKALNLANPVETDFAGFDCMIDCSNLPTGHYIVNLLQKVDDKWMVALQPNVLELV